MTTYRKTSVRFGTLIARTAALPLCSTLALLGTAPRADAAAKYTTFDPTGSVKTEAWCMNNGGAIAGNYSDGNKSHGFVRTSDGTITTFDPAGSFSTGTGYAQCINTKGWITGSYLDSSGISHGYLRSPHGKIATIDPPGSFDTYATGVNSDRTVVGSYLDSSGVSHGFFRTADGTIMSFDPPGSIYTQATQINRKGSIVGDYLDASGNPYVFVRTTDMKYTSYNLGGASVSEAFAMGINKGGTATGYVSARCGIAGPCSSGFVWTPDGTFTSFFAHFRRRDHDPFTSANCINATGVIAGNFSTNDQPQHGFMRSADGLIRDFDPPASTGTYVNGCDDNGDVTGYYLDGNGVSHGFLRSK